MDYGFWGEITKDSTALPDFLLDHLLWEKPAAIL